MPEATFKKLPLLLSVDLSARVYLKSHVLVNVVTLRNFISCYFCLASRAFSAMF